MLTARVVREGKALVLELAAPHTLAEAAHAMLHVTALVSTSMVSVSMVSTSMVSVAMVSVAMVSTAVLHVTALRHDARYVSK